MDLPNEDDDWEKASEVINNQLEVRDGSHLHQTLVEALNSAKERVSALRIEDKILQFVQSSELSFEVPPLQNSFQRLLAYLIAQRFRLAHVTSETVLENGNRSITLYKTADTTIPSMLLLDYAAVGLVITGNETKKPVDEPVVSKQCQPVVSVFAPKLMVRSKGSAPANSASKSLTSDNIPTDEVEQRYAAARARIFGDIATDSASTSASSGSAEVAPTLAPTAVAAPLMKEANPRDGKQSVYSGSSSKVVNVSNWISNDTKRRSTVRNMDQERNDPDFNRNVQQQYPRYGYSRGMDYSNEYSRNAAAYNGYYMSNAGYNSYVAAQNAESFKQSNQIKETEGVVSSSSSSQATPSVNDISEFPSL